MPQQKITIWSVAIDSDTPLYSGAFATEAAAWSEVVPTFAETTEEKHKAKEFISAGNFEGLRTYLRELIEKSGSIDSYSVEKHELTVEIPYTSDAGVSKDGRDYSVTVTADVKAGSAEDATIEFVDQLKIGNTDGLTYKVSNLKTGEYVEINA